MVFEPAFLAAEPGFMLTHKGHNVESIDGMVPERLFGQVP